MRRKSLNHYEMIRRLGSGGGGVVYYANDTKLQRPVVLKMLRRGSASVDTRRENILREARMASAIDHPNVCSIYEVSESDDQAFIVMQYVPGRSLEKLIEAGALDSQLALSIAIQMADGLAEAHRLGILHRDLKPANVMITEGGLVKILDFGLAKRKRAEDAAAVAGARRNKKRSSARVGTVAYMSPEIFVTGRSSEQSDIFALGVIVYEMVTGVHPFLQPGAAQAQTARAIQYSEPAPPRDLRPELSAELESVIVKAMAKNPANRFSSAAEMREAMKTIMKSMHLESGFVPGEASAVLPAPGAEPDKKAGLLSMLAERFMRGGDAVPPQNSIAVLPFRNLGEAHEAQFYGLALADAIATRLARLPWLIVRPSHSLMTSAALSLDHAEAGKKLFVTHILSGSFLRSDNGFDLNWQLLDARSNAIRAGSTISVKSLDLIAIQNEICDEVFAALRGAGHIQQAAPAAQQVSLDADLSENYLQARALLSNFILRSSRPDDLERAKGKFRAVLARNPQFAPALAGLGIAHLEYVRKGFGDLENLSDAQNCFERALEIDPGFVEANLFRVYTFLARGEKESARHAVDHLLETADNDFDVRMVAGIIFRMDGLYDLAMSEFGAALRLAPANAPVIYNERARIYGYEGQIELALSEIEKGMTLEPKHPLLRTSLGYMRYRQSRHDEAIETLESVLRDDPDLRMAYPTLAMCHLAAGNQERAASLITEETLAAAEADGEMAYRLATYFAMAKEATSALRWLRRSIYLGNENYPWFARNPAWQDLKSDEDFANVLSDLKKTYQSNARRWKRLIEGRAPQASA